MKTLPLAALLILLTVPVVQAADVLGWPGDLQLQVQAPQRVAAHSDILVSFTATGNASWTLNADVVGETGCTHKALNTTTGTSVLSGHVRFEGRRGTCTFYLKVTATQGASVVATQTYAGSVLYGDASGQGAFLLALGAVIALGALGIWTGNPLTLLMAFLSLLFVFIDGSLGPAWIPIVGLVALVLPALRLLYRQARTWLEKRR